MKNHSQRTWYKDVHNTESRILFVAGGIVLNVIPAFLANRFGLPLYIDTLGTVLVAAIGGGFSGIVTAVMTNAFCMLFNTSALYFAFINALIAIYISGFYRKRELNRVGSILICILTVGIGSGLVSAIVQWSMFSHAQNASIDDMSGAIAAAVNIPAFSAFCFVNLILNILDKGLCIGLAFLIIRYLPGKFKELIEKADWRQRPLSIEEIRRMKKWSKDVKRSIWKRMAFTLLIVSFTAIILMGWIGIRLYFTNEKAEKTESAQKAVRFAASVIDPDKIDDYIRNGRNVEGYSDTEKLLYQIRDNAAGVKYLYVIKIEKEGCYVAFDLETEDTPAYEPGDIIEFEEAFLPYLPAFFAGEEIEPIESDDLSGWVQTIYYPIRNDQGRCTGYVGADVSLEYMATLMRNFITRVLLMLAGFFILILSYGLWTTGVYTVYPISSIALCVDDLSKAGSDQKKLDESVKSLRSLDIRTDDELQKLYNAICTMSLNQTEQMRAIRHFSDATAKMQDGLIITMADMVENRDSDTGAHIQKTAAYVRIIVEGLRAKGYYAEKITDKYISDIVRSAPLHDVGKINIPDEVLNKPGKLTEEEFEIMKTHTTSGKNILEKAINTIHGENYLKEARNMAAYHHERWDGKGYPEGLHGEVIPLSARIMAVADVFDALTSPRVYKPAFPLEKALSIIEEGSGTQFDPKCVEVFMENLAEAKIILKKFNQFE